MIEGGLRHCTDAERQYVDSDGQREVAFAFCRLLGFLPLEDPAGDRAGQRAAFRLLYRGRPLAGARIHADAAPQGTRMDASPGAHLETDAEGVAWVCVDRPGTWNVRTLQIVPADAGPGADWDAHWATLVFEVP